MEATQVSKAQENIRAATLQVIVVDGLKNTNVTLSSFEVCLPITQYTSIPGPQYW